MTLEKIIIGAVALTGIWVFKDLILSWIGSYKSAKISKQVEEQKEKTNEAVAIANISRTSFLDKLRKYRTGRNSSDQ